MSKVEPKKPIPNTNESYTDICPRCGKPIPKVKGEIGLCPNCDFGPEKHVDEEVDIYREAGKSSELPAPPETSKYEDDAKVYGDSDVSD